MIHRLVSFVLALAALLGAARLGAGEEVRVVSQTVGTDELLYALAEPSQIAALSHISRDPAFSAIAKEAEAFPQLRLNGDVESVLRFRPTLVLVTDYSRGELVAQVRRAGVKVLVIDRYRTLEDNFASLRLLARELGPAAEARAEQIITSCRARVDTLREKLQGRPRVRVIAPSTYGVIPGDNSTFQDLCDHAAAENLAFTLGGLHGHATPPNEHMLAWPIERVVVAGFDDESALAPFKQLPPYRMMEAVRNNRIARLEPWQLSCISHYRVDAYEQLARALHPEVFP